MGGLTINSNLLSSAVQRRLARSTAELSKSFQHLSSGLRVTSAADDAAGLAISSRLDVDAKVYNQGVRNLHDGISLTSIAEGALRELASLTTRQIELAEQAANGTLSATQRQSLNAEAEALSKEYNRIVQTVSFNGKPLLDQAQLNGQALKIQAGYGANGAISFVPGTASDRAVGNFTFNSSLVGGSGVVWNQLSSINIADVNNDGYDDIALVGTETPAYAPGSAAVIVLGNNAGTTTIANSTPGVTWTGSAFADFNSDGRIDLAVFDSTADRLALYYGNGNGTFAVGASSVLDVSDTGIAIADLNRDGYVDIIGSKGVRLGNGNGTFKGLQAQSFGLVPELQDLNGDGNTDAIYRSGSSIVANYGTGSGTFSAMTTLASAGSAVTGVALADFNHDGRYDLIGAGAAWDRVFLANADGTYSAGTSFSDGGGSVVGIEIADINGDGYDDIFVSRQSQIYVYQANSDGSFKTPFTSSSWGSQTAAAVYDVNQDGASDLVVGVDYGDFSWDAQAFISNTTFVSTIATRNLSLRSGAYSALTAYKTQLQLLGAELGNIGSSTNRLSTAESNLQVMEENFIAASAQIKDVDTAAESAALVKNRILQQAGSAILGQANQAPEIALALLKGS